MKSKVLLFALCILFDNVQGRPQERTANSVVKDDSLLLVPTAAMKIEKGEDGKYYIAGNLSQPVRSHVEYASAESDHTDATLESVSKIIESDGFSKTSSTVNGEFVTPNFNDSNIKTNKEIDIKTVPKLNLDEDETADPIKSEITEKSLEALTKNTKLQNEADFYKPAEKEAPKEKFNVNGLPFLLPLPMEIMPLVSRLREFPFSPLSLAFPPVMQVSDQLLDDAEVIAESSEKGVIENINPAGEKKKAIHRMELGPMAFSTSLINFQRLLKDINDASQQSSEKSDVMDMNGKKFLVQKQTLQRPLEDGFGAIMSIFKIQPVVDMLSISSISKEAYDGKTNPFLMKQADVVPTISSEMSIDSKDMNAKSENSKMDIDLKEMEAGQEYRKVLEESLPKKDKEINTVQPIVPYVPVMSTVLDKSSAVVPETTSILASTRETKPGSDLSLRSHSTETDSKTPETITTTKYSLVPKDLIFSSSNNPLPEKVDVLSSSSITPSHPIYTTMDEKVSEALPVKVPIRSLSVEVPAVTAKTEILETTTNSEQTNLSTEEDVSEMTTKKSKIDGLVSALTSAGMDYLNKKIDAILELSKNQENIVSKKNVTDDFATMAEKKDLSIEDMNMLKNESLLYFE